MKKITCKECKKEHPNPPKDIVGWTCSQCVQKQVPHK